MGKGKRKLIKKSSDDVQAVVLDDIPANSYLDEWERIRRKNSKNIILVSFFIMIFAALILIYFFTSDIPDKLYQVRIAQVEAQTIKPEEVLVDDEVVGVMEDGVLITSAPGVVLHIEGETLLDYLNSPSGSDLSVFLKDLLKIPEGESLEGFIDANSAGPTTEQILKEAYVEAERLYPGQIDVSKRLHLINELNAKGYMYYVVESGDTMIGLCDAFNVSLGQLIETNGIQDANVISEGVIMLFPVDTVDPAIP